jgi:hypothetical protein
MFPKDFIVRAQKMGGWELIWGKIGWETSARDPLELHVTHQVCQSLTPFMDIYLKKTCDMAVIPGGMTSKLQPLISVKPLKD